MATKQPKKYKLKTHKASASRIHITGTGKMMKLHGQRSHLRRKKTSDLKRGYDQKEPVAIGVVRRLRKLLPYA
ncbi:MAG: 50S ribosomal protein L35 [Chloroflexota bacterium]|nr:50S ribosomal protein L35 [Chloroflexota bacterium]